MLNSLSRQEFGKSMKIIAYTYTNPLLDSPPDNSIWAYSPEQVYQDFGDRSQRQQLLRDCQGTPPDC